MDWTAIALSAELALVTLLALQLSHSGQIPVPGTV